MFRAVIAHTLLFVSSLAVSGLFLYACNNTSSHQRPRTTEPAVVELGTPQSDLVTHPLPSKIEVRTVTPVTSPVPTPKLTNPPVTPPASSQTFKLRVKKINHTYGAALSDSEAAQVMAIEDSYAPLLSDYAQQIVARREALFDAKIKSGQILRPADYHPAQDGPIFIIIPSGRFPELDSLYNDRHTVKASIRNVLDDWIKRNSDRKRDD